MKVIVLMVQQL